MEPSENAPNKPAGARRLFLFRPQRLAEHVAASPVSAVSPVLAVTEISGVASSAVKMPSLLNPAAPTVLSDAILSDPAVDLKLSEKITPSTELSPLDAALAMMAALVAPDVVAAPAPAPVAPVAPVAEPAQTNTLAHAAPTAQNSAPTLSAAAPSDPSFSPANPVDLVSLVSPTSPFDPSKGAPPPAPKRMSFAAMDAKLDKDVPPASPEPEPSDAMPSFPVANSTNPAKTAITTAEKTEKSVSDMRLQQAIVAAKKVKGQLDMEKFGLHNEAQWLLFSPHRYDDYKNITDNFSRLMAGNVAVVKGTMVSKKFFDENKRETTNFKMAVRMLAVLKDVTGKTIPLNAFGKPGFAWRGYEEGDSVIIRVKPQRAFSGYGLELNNPEIVKKSLLNQIVPIYPPLRVTKGDKFAIEVNRNLGLLDMAAEIVEDDSGWHDKHAPVRMDELTKFKSAHDMLRALHRPISVQQGDDAMLAAKRLSSYTLVRKTAERSKAIKVNPKSMINIDPVEIESLKKRLPYKLTGDQESAIDGIVKSLRGPKPMDGLLSGDVGTGKTAAFLIPMVAAHKAGKRVMLLTPNLLLIAQVARELRTYFPEMSVCTVNGKGGIQGDHESSIIIGSTALINAMKKGKIGKKPDFLVVDEQHKFSVEQRDALKDTHTNKIEATATPIPRTAAMATHGAHDLFLLRDVPVVKSIRTEVLGLENGKQAGQAVIDALRRGEQACVIYPLVNATLDENGEPTKNAKKAVNGAAENWKSFVAIEDIAVLHGKMKDDEKEAVLNDFRAGNKKLLLASIVIEVGVTLPELKTMLVTDADRFGVVTLHQLRGRLARHGGEGHFVLYSENTDDPEVLERLNLVKDNIDGFDLAEKDAEVRGFGDLLGIDGDNQSGATKALFQGVKIGPKDISFAAHLHEKAISIGDSDEDNQQIKKSQGMRPA